MQITTIYGKLWKQVIARPQRDQPLADQLRRAHNREVYRRIAGKKAVDVPVPFAEEVTALSLNKATAKRIVIEPENGFYSGELRS